MSTRRSSAPSLALLPHTLAAAGLAALVVTGGLGGCIAPQPVVESAWDDSTTSTWIGPDYWANRLQDWRRANGRVECIDTRLPYRTLHATTDRVALDTGTLEQRVALGVLAPEDLALDAAAGFLIGAGAADLDWRAACLVQSAPGPDGGWFCGVTAEGELVIRDFSQEDPTLDDVAVDLGLGTYDGLIPVELYARVVAERGWAVTLEVVARDLASGEELARARREGIDGADLAGNLALVSHAGTGKERSGFWFDDWERAGTRLDRDADRRIGPIVGAFHTLSEGTLKLSAQLLPAAGDDARFVALDARRNGSWVEIARAEVDPQSFSALLRVDDWDARVDTPYRLRCADQEYTGTVRRDPLDEDELVLAALSCNHQVRHGFGRPGYPWSDAALWFPHDDLTANLERHDPDVLFFAGDQIYEGASPTPADKKGEPALDYLYKWTLFCLAFGDLARDRPTIVIPDDHDVYQGNLWGAGGRAAKRDNQGGYVMPADWVRMVERTQTAHLPDPFDPTPIDQGIGVYYTNVVYGGVGMAVLEDRKFKSGCADLSLGGPRPDHITDAAFDPSTADAPGKELLGARQLAFLDAWARDWRGQEMKLALSQTVFANVATNHGRNQDRLVADLDSNGWPQSGRDRALDALRKAFALHVAGDQHLSTLVHHGIDAYEDAGWSFTVPAIANFYARAWRPEGPAEVPIDGLPQWAGSRRDGFGNRVTVVAATNPDGSTGRTPKALHDQMPGYGIVRVDKRERTYTVECWPRYAELGRDPQYSGWPVTLSQRDQYGRQAGGYLPELNLSEWDAPVVQVFNDAGELLYALRPAGERFQPWTFSLEPHEVLVLDPDTDESTRLRLGAIGEPTVKAIRVERP